MHAVFSMGSANVQPKQDLAEDKMYLRPAILRDPLFHFEMTPSDRFNSMTNELQGHAYLPMNTFSSSPIFMNIQMYTHTGQVLQMAGKRMFCECGQGLKCPYRDLHENSKLRREEFHYDNSIIVGCILITM